MKMNGRLANKVLFVGELIGFGITVFEAVKNKEKSIEVIKSTEALRHSDDPKECLKGNVQMVKGLAKVNAVGIGAGVATVALMTGNYAMAEKAMDKAEAATRFMNHAVGSFVAAGASSVSAAVIDDDDDTEKETTGQQAAPQQASQPVKREEPNENSPVRRSWYPGKYPVLLAMSGDVIWVDGDENNVKQFVEMVNTKIEKYWDAYDSVGLDDIREFCGLKTKNDLAHRIVWSADDNTHCPLLKVTYGMSMAVNPDGTTAWVQELVIGEDFALVD